METTDENDCQYHKKNLKKKPTINGADISTGSWKAQTRKSTDGLIIVSWKTRREYIVLMSSQEYGKIPE